MPKDFTICVIDDDAVYQFIVTKSLQSKKTIKNVLNFSNGAGAIEFLMAHSHNRDKLPDVIFLDVSMPVMNGWEFLEAYVKIKPTVDKKISIYMVTSSVDPADMVRARRISELSGYIVKPLQADLLKSILEALEKETHVNTSFEV